MGTEYFSDIFVLASAMASIVALMTLGKISKSIDDIQHLITAYHKIDKPKIEAMDDKLNNLLEIKKAKRSEPVKPPSPDEILYPKTDG